jgi:acetaldehyde dehydrogenase
MRVAILGTGNIGTDLMEKVRRSERLELALFAGIDPDSSGIARAREHGMRTSTAGVEALFELDEPVELVFDATSAAVHVASAHRLAAAGVTVVDLTPARLGPPVVPCLNADSIGSEHEVSLITCGGQATVPIVAAVNAASPVGYAEIVSTIASLSAGPGTRQNIDEFTRTTAAALVDVGGAESGKAIIVLNPADPPIKMRNTVFCVVPDGADEAAIDASVRDIVERVARYVPGYRLVGGPEFDQLPDGRSRVSVFLEITGSGDFLPPYAGNLDIMTAAAVAVAEELAGRAEPVPAPR